MGCIGSRTVGGYRGGGGGGGRLGGSGPLAPPPPLSAPPEGPLRTRLPARPRPHFPRCRLPPAPPGLASLPAPCVLRSPRLPPPPPAGASLSIISPPRLSAARPSLTLSGQALRPDSAFPRASWPPHPVSGAIPLQELPAWGSRLPLAWVFCPHLFLSPFLFLRFQPPPIRFVHVQFPSRAGAG